MTYDCLMDYPSMLNLFSYFCYHFYHRRRKTGKFKKKSLHIAMNDLEFRNYPFSRKIHIKNCIKYWLYESNKFNIKANIIEDL